MCGIAGYVLLRPGIMPAGSIDALLSGIRDRGPDDEGACLIDRTTGSVLQARTTYSRGTDATPLADACTRTPHDVALANTRFAIFDPTPAGHQPFASADKSVTAVFNGEIYNHPELRRELERAGVTFRTSCDTEVLVEGFRAWGDSLWPRLNGFWAVAIHDANDGSITLSRDRLGVAPLYLRETDDAIFFASSIRSLRRVQHPVNGIRENRVCGFIETSLKDFDSATLFEGIDALPPATVLRIPRDAPRLARSAERRFWSLPATRLASSDISLDEAVAQLRDVLFSAVELRLRADVPVAFELSGGLDSSSIVAAAASMRAGTVTYTIEVPEHNEEPFARAMLQRYDIDYRVLREPERDFMRHAVQFGRAMEEPFHSPNIYTHYEMRQRMKAEGIDVVLSGSGGDEVLAGYEPLFWPQARREMRADGDDRVLRRHVIAMHARQLRSWPLMRSRARRTALRLRRMLGGRVSVEPGRVKRARSADNPAVRLDAAYAELPWQQQRAYHFETGLLPYYLRSNDHFTMAIPIEHRFPFLDYRVVELGVRLPPSYLFRDGWTKYALRRAMEPYLPPSITWRRDKMGFPFPYARFLVQNRQALQQYVDVARTELPCAPRDEWAAMLAADPVRLWRLCSTGIWLSGMREAA